VRRERTLDLADGRAFVRDGSPDRRTMPTPALPAAVAIAAIVSWSCMRATFA